MNRYKNEAEFSKVFVKHLREDGWFVQRIETRETGRGVPDIYAVSPSGVAYWYELKRIHAEIAGLNTAVTIPWRAGQQSWMRNVIRYKQHANTIACFDDCILVIPHNKMYEDNQVRPGECYVVHTVREL